MCNCGAEIETAQPIFWRCQYLASEGNLHDELYLIDPSGISFDEESLLNALYMVKISLTIK